MRVAIGKHLEQSSRVYVPPGAGASASVIQYPCNIGSSAFHLSRWRDLYYSFLSFLGGGGGVSDEPPEPLDSASSVVPFFLIFFIIIIIKKKGSVRSPGEERFTLGQTFGDGAAPPFVHWSTVGPFLKMQQLPSDIPF